MSDDKKWPRGEALKVAEEIAEVLRPCCVRFEIAGSLRRGKSRVSDVEVLFIPLIESRADPNDLFGNKILFDVANQQVEALTTRRVIEPRLNVDGRQSWGYKNKLAVHVATGIPVDFFATTEENWWVSLVVRTGSLESNLRLTRGALDRGRTLLAYGCGVQNIETGQVTRAESEREVFELCGQTYRPPEERG